MRSEGLTRTAGSARSRRIASALGLRPSDARKAVGKWKETAYLQTKEHPARSVALAIGAGYLLGGGLFTRLTGRLVGRALRVGLRLSAVPLVRQGLKALTQGQSGRSASSRTKPAARARSNGPRVAG